MATFVNFAGMVGLVAAFFIGCALGALVYELAAAFFYFARQPQDPADAYHRRDGRS